MITGFSICRRNFGHWDISSQDHGRLFRLRGGPGQWDVIDERKNVGARSGIATFKDQSAAMAWICAELMHELLTVDGQEPYVMESWNIKTETVDPYYPASR